MLLHPQLADGEFSYSGKNTDPTLPAVEVDNSSRAVDELREAESKGAGLTMLKKSLSSFAKNGLMPISDPEISATERQKSLEANTVQAAIDRWREEDAHLRSMGLSSRLASSELGAMMWSWHEKLVPLIKDDIQKSQGLERKEGKNLTSTDKEFLAWGPHLQALSPEMASAVTILVAMKTCSTDPLDDKGVRIHNLVAAVGEAVQSESMVQAIRASTVGNRKPISTYFNKNRLRVSASSERNHLEWNTSLKVKLGAALVAHLLEIAKVNVAKHNPKTGLEVRESQPVFFHTYLYIAGKRIGVVRLNSVVLEKMSKMPVASALAKYLPMLCEPKPWVGYSEGGFLEYPAPVIRLPFGDKQAKRYAVAATENGDMTQVFAGLDVLGKTPWNINRFVFEVMLQVWNSGKAMAKIPPEHPPNDFPPEPASSHDNYKERSLWMKLMRESENRRSALRSQRCFLNFQLEVARAYLDETFYFPHNCDFRGRAYPMIPFLNHMGSDNVRGLLVFGEGKELTANGLWWLKVHLANVYGFDKASFAERLEFTETHVREIRDSVDNPLDGSQWWLQAEDPWQCLAACKELVNALDLPDPTKYISKLAIHQDGTCNGLQHYAALGGDAAGAQQVNLEPGERPSDIYTGVAMLVKAEISKDAAQGNALAKELDGKVTRKVVKQTVMTNVYGVTFQGARQQVRKQLNDLLVGFPDSEELNLHSASGYVAKKIFAALATMFNGAHDIQYWLTDCAGRISESLAPEQMEYIEQASKGMIPPTQFKKIPVGRKSGMGMADFKTTVIWTTPLKMPVVQPYRKITPKRIDTNLQKISIMDRSAADAVDRSKQVQAFPPNFIHSLDATHMFLTALKCNEIGITFAAIHDSFWTHAGDVDTMNNVIRDAFIRMHSEDIVGRLAAEFNTRYKGFMQLVGVKSGSPAGQKIRLWRRQRYMHLRKNEAIKGRTAKDLKSRQIDELLLERQRLKLLASQDHKERREGEQMNTPASILSWLGDEETLTPTLTSTTVKPASLGLGLSSRNAKLKANQRLDVGNLENGEPVLPALDSGAGTVEDDGVANVSETHSAGKAVDDFQEEDDIEHREAVGSETNELEPSERTKRDRKISVWVPLTFPPVPKKVCSAVLKIWHRITDYAYRVILT